MVLNMFRAASWKLDFHRHDKISPGNPLALPAFTSIMKVGRSSVLARHGEVGLLCAVTSPFVRTARTAIVTGKIHFKNMCY